MVTLPKPNQHLFKDECRINSNLLPFKFHFFFSFGGFAAVMPFMPIIAKQLGISATAVGVAYALIPVFTFLSNPIIGFLVDYFQNIKSFLITLLVISAISYSSIMSLPPIVNESENISYIQVFSFNDSVSPFNFSTLFQRSCLQNFWQNGVECTLEHENQTMLFYSNLFRQDNVKDADKNIFNISLLGDQQDKIILFYTNDSLFSHLRDNISLMKSTECSPDIYHCSTDALSINSAYSAYQFWVFFCLAVIATVAMMSASSLNSVASLELLGTQKELYGRQRLFGTISWGIICPLAGILNDLQTQKNFTSSIFLMSIFIVIDIIILCVISIPKAYSSSNMGRDICKVFSSVDILVFSFGIVIIGILNSIIAVFEFWFLEDLGASRTLLGMSVFMQCIVGEVPFLFFSGSFVKSFGHFLCFAFSFGGFLLRLVFYYFLKNPWFALPVDILHGVTFGVFHGAMTSFAKLKAPKGMEATLLGSFGGLYDGLGYGIGSFLGGLGLDKFGPKKTFFSASMLSLGCFILFIAASFLFPETPEEKNYQSPQLKMKQTASNE